MEKEHRRSIFYEVETRRKKDRMKISEVIRRIEEKHVKLDSSRQTCDGVSYGDIDRECTGIVLTCWPSVRVIREAAGLGCNVILCHEPTFFDGMDETDWLEDDSICRRKKELLRETGIVVYRDHDHMHSEMPDMIYSGIVRQLGWEKYAAEGTDYFPSTKYVLPEMTLQELGTYVGKCLHIDGIRIIGNPDWRIRNVGLLAHFFGNELDRASIRDIERKALDVIIPLEVIDWTIAEYIEDSIALGKRRALLNVGHFNLEEAGMEQMQGWLREAVGDDIPIRFVSSGNTYRWMETGR